MHMFVCLIVSHNPLGSLHFSSLFLFAPLIRWFQMTFKFTDSFACSNVLLNPFIELFNLVVFFSSRICLVLFLLYMYKGRGRKPGIGPLPPHHTVLHQEGLVQMQVKMPQNFLPFWCDFFLTGQSPGCCSSLTGFQRSYKVILVSLLVLVFNISMGRTRAWNYLLYQSISLSFH